MCGSNVPHSRKMALVSSRILSVGLSARRGLLCSPCFNGFPVEAVSSDRMMVGVSAQQSRAATWHGVWPES